MKVSFKGEEGFMEKHYTIYEFKGKFDSERPDDCRSLIHLGTLCQLPDGFRLQIGVMDLIGRSAPVRPNMLYTETVEGDHPSERIILVKGLITKKIVFDRRPVPDMDRAEVQDKYGGRNFFKLDKKE